MNPELLISKAILAPSGHNAQAWKFSISDNGEITLSPDFSHSLPIIDPQNRELFISLGCALENIAIYAHSMGFKPCINEEKGNITITCNELAPVAHEDLAQAIDTRQTNRSIYNGKTIPLKDLFKLKTGGVCIYPNGSEDFAQISKLVELANYIQLSNKGFKNELKQWLRYNDKEAELHRDGLNYNALGTINIPPFLRKIAVSLGLNSSAQNASDTKKILSSSHLAIFTGNDTISEWINVGRRLEHFLLCAETMGIACAYMNQPCEVPSIRNILKESLNLNEQPQIIVRLGYAERAPKSHRRPLSTFFI